MIKNSVILLLAFASAFLPRVLDAVGFPSVVNFAHFVFIPLAGIFTFLQIRSKIRVQMALELLTALLILLAIVIFSALLNKAGVVNVFLDFMLRAEWFIFLLAMISITPTEKSLRRLRFWFLSFAFINIFFAFVQKFILRWGEGRPAAGDFITGVFLGQGAGCDVSSGVSIIFAIYYFTSSKKSPLWIRIAVAVFAIIHLFITDAKSHLLVFLVALILVMLTKLKLTNKSITLFLKYLVLAILFLGGIHLASQTVAPSLLAFSREDQMQDGLDLKFSIFSIVTSHYQSPLNLLFGLGPGHTVGRLGGWILRDYASLLEPLGVTKFPASQEAWDAVWSTWIGPRSRLWSPFFGWAGIWGDWGLFGLAAFIYVMFVAWRRFCVDDACRVILMSVAVFGFIFTQMEEPGYVISVAAILGLRWQEVQLTKQSRDRQLQLIYNSNPQLELN
ncbi:hypothetical protein [Fischerella thermalis]|uniref:Uncharacterized protein n=1 Tax=Fischerella thermalis CCMEE 5318 TaxID=2019666 RepID=A0A2N6LLR8_9CYAN|nr:hypothetical protein [Fischerella thermalis]PMB26032.1 hypothetical protein CEN46_04555 [Fischerella thermalis CCMEE 5318]